MFTKNSFWNLIIKKILDTKISEELKPPFGIIARSKNFILHQDPVTPIPGFFVIASKKHMVSVGEGPSVEHGGSILRGLVGVNARLP